MSTKPVRLTLELSPELNASLENIAERTCSSKSDILRKAIALIEVAVRAKEEGRRFGVAQPGQELATEVVGL